MSNSTEALHGLLSAAAVRERAHEMLDIALAGGVDGWTVDLDRLDDAAARTATVTREAYPDLAIPFHARWRHFVAGEPALPSGAGSDPAPRARAGAGNAGSSAAHRRWCSWPRPRPGSRCARSARGCQRE